MALVFISYRKTKRSIAEALARWLVSRDFEVWWDKQLEAGQEFRGQIEKALADAQVVIVLWSHDVKDSKFVLDEADEANKHSKLLPLLIEEGVKIPLGFRSVQAYDLQGWTGDLSDARLPGLERYISQVRDKSAAQAVDLVGRTLETTAPGKLGVFVMRLIARTTVLELPLYRLLIGAVTVAAALAAVTAAGSALDGRPDFLRTLQDFGVSLLVVSVSRLLFQGGKLLRQRTSRRFYDGEVWFRGGVCALIAPAIVALVMPNLTLGLVLEGAPQVALWLLFAWGCLFLLTGALSSKPKPLTPS